MTKRKQAELEAVAEAIAHEICPDREFIGTYNRVLARVAIRALDKFRRRKR